MTADPAVGQKRDPKFARKLLEATSAIRTSGAPGVLVRVKRGGQTYELALGLASISEKRPATTATVWRIASVTKLIVAHLALDLSSRGLLRIERPLSETMSGLPPLLARIPVRNLLDHSSRVPEYLDQDV
ncbi:MAG: serine hydrolase domain-containing protein, partial [Pseudomonadota bacterium]